MNCQSPLAPIREVALGLRADSTMAKYLISLGT